MPNNARRKRKNMILGLGNSLKKEYPQPSYSDKARGSGKGKVYSLHITDVIFRSGILSVAVVIQDITGWTGMKAENCSSDAYKGTSTLIALSEDKKQVENWKEKLEKAGATASIKES